MIVHLNTNITETEARELAHTTSSTIAFNGSFYVLVTPSAVKELPSVLSGKTSGFWAMESDIQLASRKYLNDTRLVQWGNTSVGGQTKNTVVIAGPCSVESEEQIMQSAEMLVSLGINTLRAGCYKPRTSPYSFQGLGLEGLLLLSKMREKYGLKVITEVKDSSHIEEVIEHTDIIQIGAKAMYDHSILRRCGQINKPVLLKRGFGSTLQEFVQAAEFILSAGNEQVMLCERGIRTFETKTRFTFDLCGAAYLKEFTNLPVILDPSHAMGYAYGVPDLAKASVAFGCDGLLIEVHPNPKVAKSDASQQLDHAQFAQLHGEMKVIAGAVGRQLI
jgi:3-deoxy-7-phosphoheptulonate synthase